MSRRRRSRVSSSSEQSATSEMGENSNTMEDLPDVAFGTKNPKDVKDKKRVSFSFALAADPDNAASGCVDLTGEQSSTPPALPPRPRRKTKAELKEIVDLTTGENIQILPMTNENDPTKKQADEKTAAEREAKKQASEDEQRANRAWERVNTTYKPGDCMKHMYIQMNRQLSQMWYMEELKSELSSLGVRLLENDALEPDVLVWSQDMPSTLRNIGGQLKVSTERRECGHRLYIVQAQQLYTIVVGGGEGGGAAFGGDRLGGGTVAVLLIQDLNKGAQPQIDPSKSDVLKTLSEFQIGLMLDRGLELTVVQCPRELATLAVSLTRSLADQLHKQTKHEIDGQAAFYMRGDNKNCVTVDKDGNGLGRLWEQMIATLPMSSLEVARSLGSKYKSPRALVSEFQSSGGTSQISEIGVSRTNVPGSKTRKLGPEFSKKLHTLFTCEDGNKLIV